MGFLQTSRRKAGSAIASFALALVAAISTHAIGDSGSTDDAIARLGRRLADGTASLEYREGAGYLPSLLHLLGIDVDSQVLVFSKTSFQHTLINPKNPRALYFNDNVAIGMVQGGTVYEMNVNVSSAAAPDTAPVDSNHAISNPRGAWERG